ncbi:MAG: substrate-binding domain-containing protein [Bacteroidota bacterium]
MSENKNYRIKDIALLAGVSEGTVDRVLHSRGNVSDSAFTKVNEILNKINYKPNLIARSLGRGLKQRIAVLSVDPKDDPYWNEVHKGILQAQDEWNQYGITIDTYFFMHDGEHSFEHVAERALDTEPHGLVMAPIFHPPALAVIESLKEYNLPYILFNTDIPKSEAMSFIGQNLYDSGKLAGFLCSLGQNTTDRYEILTVGEDTKDSVYLSEKENGFRDYFHDNSLNNEIHNYVLAMDSHEFHAYMDKILSDRDLKGIFITTSKATPVVSEKIYASKRKDIRLVAYDLLESNLKYLDTGIISFLINQNPKRQAFMGISHMVNYLLFNKTIPREDLFPLEIITRHNVNSYLNSIIH